MKKSKIDEIMYDDNICWPSALFEYLSNNVQYPVVAEENGIQGREIRLVESMPNWIPGKQNGEPVRVKYTVPVTFRL